MWYREIVLYEFVIDYYIFDIFFNCLFEIFLKNWEYFLIVYLLVILFWDYLKIKCKEVWSWYVYIEVDYDVIWEWGCCEYNMVFNVIFM